MLFRRGCMFGPSEILLKKIISIGRHQTLVYCYLNYDSFDFFD